MQALAKFVKCINWGSTHEAAQALDLINKWTPMDVEDALELLGPSFKHPGLRHYAVTRLREASDGDLELYLLQLVQALKYENHVSGESWLASEEENMAAAAVSEAGGTNFINFGDSSSSSPPPPIMRVESSGEAAEVAEAGAVKGNGGATARDGGDGSSAAPPTSSEVSSAQGDAPLRRSFSSSSESSDGLASFLINRACNNSCKLRHVMYIFLAPSFVTHYESIRLISYLFYLVVTSLLHIVFRPWQRSRTTFTGTSSSSARTPPRTDCGRLSGCKRCTR